MDKKETVKTTVILEKEEYRKLKLLCVNQFRSISALIRDLIRDYVNRKDKGEL